MSDDTNFRTTATRTHRDTDFHAAMLPCARHRKISRLHSGRARGTGPRSERTRTNGREARIGAGQIVVFGEISTGKWAFINAPSSAMKLPR